jgi:hypothetical protein
MDGNRTRDLRRVGRDRSRHPACTWTTTITAPSPFMSVNHTHPIKRPHLESEQEGVDGASLLRRQHRCLEIPEIIDLIFECVSELGWVLNLPAFVALASTCRAFHQPAVKYLWTRLDDLRPLAAVFPKGSWRYRKDEKGKTVVVSE